MRYSELLIDLQNLIKIKPTQQSLAKILGIGQTAISGRAQRNSEFSQEELLKLEQAYGLPYGVLSTKNEGTDNCIQLEYIHISPSCGHGTVVVDNADVTPVKIGQEVIKDLWNVNNPDVLKLFKASGDSMDPTIEDGNILLVDTSRVDYHNGGIYVLTLNNDWFVKRLRLRMTGELDIISDNDKYPIETLKPDTETEVKVIGRVIKNLSRGL